MSKTLSKEEIDHFFSLIGERPWRLLRWFNREGLDLTFVGGAIRDFIYASTPPVDLDIEVRKKDADVENWEEVLKSYFEKLTREHNIPYEELPFGVYRVSLKGWEIEFSSPRLEHYELDKPAAKGHSDFTVTLSPHLSHKESFSRRDLTLNSIGIHLTQGDEGLSYELADPYGGISDLYEKKLKHIDEKFFLDPVRFLRLLRFSLQFGARIDSDLYRDLGKFDLRKLTKHYFLKEGIKAGIFPFCFLFFSTVEEHQIPIPPELEKLKFLKTSELKGLQAHTHEEALLIFLSRFDGPLEKSTLTRFQEFLGLKKTFAQKSWALKGLQSKKFRQMIDNFLNLSLKFEAPEEFAQRKEVKELEKQLSLLEYFLKLGMSRDLLVKFCDDKRAFDLLNLSSETERVFKTFLQENKPSPHLISSIKLYFALQELEG